MAEHGYVKWWRCGMQNSLWNERPFDSWHAWDYLMARAAFDTHRVNYQKRSFILKRGQLVSTYRQLARDWGWSNHRVKRFLNSLVSERTFTKNVPEIVPLDDPQLVIEELGGCIVITLCNYAAYQDAKNEEDLRYLLKHARRPSTRPTHRPTRVPPASHPRPTDVPRDKKGKNVQQQQEGKERTSVEPKSPVDAPPAQVEDVVGGDGGGDAVAVGDAGETGQGTEATGRRDPALAQVSVQRASELLQDVGVDAQVASSLATQRPVGEILDIVVEARGKRKPAGHARRAVERGWVAPVCVGPEVGDLLAKLEDDASKVADRFQKVAGAEFLLPRKLERLPAEDDRAYLSRVQSESRARTGMQA